MVKVMNQQFTLHDASRQGGAALVTGLVFLVVLTMIGITASRMAGLEERMSGNMRDRALAMQAAEMALRDAERDIRNAVVASARGVSGTFPIGTADCAGSSAIGNGVCDSPNTPRAPSFLTTQAAYWGNSANNSVGYGTFTGAPAITGLPIQPRYILERFTKDFGGVAYYYRITARAQGINANTVVWLQETYRAN